jgi:hypothetical protein
MSMFEERERGYEAKWAHDEETLFRIMARRDNGLGEWAAALMNLSSADSAAYVGAVLQMGMVGKGPDPVMEKIAADFRTHGAACSAAELAAKAKALRREAEEHFRKPV